MNDAKRVQQAKTQAECYEETAPDAPQSSTRAGPRTPSEWTDMVGQRIEQAMRAGAFDNLPGRGKPLNLQRDPFIPEDQQMAFKLLQNNDLKPAWISERQLLLDAIAQLRRSLATRVQDYQGQAQRLSDPAARAALQAAWSVQLTHWREEIATLNKRIDLLNLQQPAQLEIVKPRLDQELAVLGAGPTLLDHNAAE